MTFCFVVVNVVLFFWFVCCCCCCFHSGLNKGPFRDASGNLEISLFCVEICDENSMLGSPNGPLKGKAEFCY